MSFNMMNQSDLEIFDNVTKPGFAHLVLKSINSQPHDKDGNMLPDVEVEILAEVVNHDDQSQITKGIRMLFNKPDQSHSDNGRFASIVLCRLAKALAVLPNVPPGAPVEVTWENGMRAGQLCVLLKEDNYESHGKVVNKIKLDGAKVWNPHDPELPKACHCSQPVLSRFPNPWATNIQHQQQQQQQVQQPAQQQQFVQQPLQQPAQQQQVQQPAQGQQPTNAFGNIA